MNPISTSVEVPPRADARKTDMLTVSEIESIIRDNHPEVLNGKLTDTALRKGGENNITLIIIGGQRKK
jgi:serine/threonine protein phosphatase PrpC